MKKTYYENLQEITKDELFDGLLGYGFFAEKIPPFLSAESFLKFCKNPPKGFTFENKPRKYINYESMRHINIPRVLAIPHPIAYHNQCQILKDNWDEILKHFKEKIEDKKHKVSRIHIRKIDNSLKVFETCYQDMEDIDLNDYPTLIANHLFDMNHKNFCTDDYPQPELMIGKRYIVKADISNCFPSIYSHSIPWALVGKDVAK
ncbi:MAG: reverse transcriptase, partial [Sulfurovum sp.]|nr:reverse transcriptase [Sulfurovum sp.]